MLNLFTKNKILRKVKLVYGFTLVEMMVAIAVFSLVMTVAMSALLSVINANQKAQTIKAAMNNVNMALETISKDMRMGTEYGCLDSSGAPEKCNENSGHSGIYFKSSKAGNPYVYYKYNATDLRLESCEGGTAGGACNSTYSDLTAPDVDITDVKFYVLGVDDVNAQPRMVMTVSGTAGKKIQTQTTFNLQTGVSQRVRSLITSPSSTP